MDLCGYKGLAINVKFSKTIHNIAFCMVHGSLVLDALTIDFSPLISQPCHDLTVKLKDTSEWVISTLATPIILIYETDK